MRQLALYIGREAHLPSTAAKLIREINDQCATYARQPNMGTGADQLREGQRYFTHKRWIIFYSQVDDGILIESIVDGARDFPSLFL